MTPHETSVVDCDAYMDAIDQLIDGELAGPALEALENHLASCPLCVALVDRLFAISNDLHALPQLTCPDRVIEAVRTHHRSDRAPIAARMGYAAICLAAAAALALVLFPWQLTAPNQPEPSSSAQLAEARQAIAKLSATLAQSDTAVGQETLRRGLVEPLGRAFSVVGKTKLGKWSAAMGVLIDASSTPEQSKDS
ncbi:anti-sigma factor family protein [Botrimarina hoheduenensis]|uniref:Putative zinc-finger domain-containing protein n=1 Tax=Botrimarina hoheduenensis TaxID=2528000 RepID=A0A5C5W9N9_9BACT|nr:zf-HC2 domain-containing protein [Botrimarina hoheduenensis]TWT46749.1 hypothetical protein Pla111_18500 [Botrimarina hoheduenensis]